MRGMKTTKGDRDRRSSKAARRTSRKTKDRRGTTTASPCACSGARWITSCSSASSRRPRSLDLDAPWPDVSSLVLPILRRVRHPYPPEASADARLRPARRLDRLRHRLRAGLHARHGDQVERWGIDHATLLGTALENLRALTVVEPPRVERIHPEGVETIADPGPGLGVGAHPRPGRPAPDPR